MVLERFRSIIMITFSKTIRRMTCEAYVTEGDALHLNSQTAGSDSTMTLWLPHYHLEQGYIDTVIVEHTV